MPDVALPEELPLRLLGVLVLDAAGLTGDAAGLCGQLLGCRAAADVLGAGMPATEPAAMGNLGIKSGPRPAVRPSSEPDQGASAVGRSRSGLMPGHSLMAVGAAEEGRLQASGCRLAIVPCSKACCSSSRNKLSANSQAPCGCPDHLESLFAPYQ